jgi:hypothetical protein
MRMSDHDHARFAELSADFVEACPFARPFHLVVLDGRGSVTVARYGVNKVEELCSGPSRSHSMKMIPPLVVVAVSSDGTCRSSMIEIVPARATMQ